MTIKYGSLFFSFAFFLSAQPRGGSTHTYDGPIVQPTERIIKSNLVFTKILAEVVEVISSWDEDKNSSLCQLHKYIQEGHSTLSKEAVLEALAHAEEVVEEKNSQLSQDQLGIINEALDQVSNMIEQGLLSSTDEDLNKEISRASSCGKLPNSCEKPLCKIECCERGPRGHRGHRGHAGPTGATGADGSTVTGANVGAGTGLIFRDKTGIFINFKSLIEGSFFSITNNVSDITLDVNGTNLNVFNTLVARDSAGNFSASIVSMTDGVASGNLVLETEPSTAIAGNVIKGSNRFIHDFGTDNTFVGIDAGNFTLTGTNNSGFGKNALLALTSGDGNTAVGAFALVANTAGTDNTAVGYNALVNNNDIQSVAVGSGALQNFVGGSGGQNVAVGFNALNANVDAWGNTAVGWSALASDVTVFGNNTAVGWSVLQDNTTGSSNTAMGNVALRSNTTGIANVAVGDNALASNTEGPFNVAIGAFAMESNIDGSRNVAVGTNAMQENTTGRFNTAVGDYALNANITGGTNVAVGISSLLFSIDGDRNTAVGAYAMQNNDSGSSNVAVGQASLINCITGIGNVAIGDNAWSSGDENVIVGASAGSDGSGNVGIGYQVLSSNSGNNNVAVGYNSMSSFPLVNGNNAALGYQALRRVKGSFNIALGSDAGANSTLITSNNNIYIGNIGVDESDTIRIGTLGTHSRCFVQGIDGVVTGLAAVSVLVDGNGQLGTISSSKRFKHDIADMGDDSSEILNLRPVTFVYNSDASETRQYGLIAEEVEEVFPAIVVRNADDQPQTVQYQVLPVLLLNELKKQKMEFAQAIEMINNRLAALENQQ